MQSIRRAWLDLEWMSVEAGIRPCCITTVTPDEMLRLSPRWLEHDMTGHLIDIVAFSGYTFANMDIRPLAGQPFGLRLVVGRVPDVKRLVRAVEAADHETIGMMLGYPPCCTEFFRQVWVEGAMIDTTWPMAANSKSTRPDATTIQVAGPWEANILWRWWGVRPVPSLPCSCECAGTISFARALCTVARENGQGETVDWMREILSWPVKWSSLHGIAEITTPVCKVSTPTDPTGVRHTVERTGTSYPEEGAQGLGFPYKAPAKARSPLVAINAQPTEGAVC